MLIVQFVVLEWSVISTLEPPKLLLAVLLLTKPILAMFQNEQALKGVITQCVPLVCLVLPDTRENTLTVRTWIWDHWYAQHELRQLKEAKPSTVIFYLPNLLPDMVHPECLSILPLEKWWNISSLVDLELSKKSVPAAAWKETRKLIQK